MLFKFRFDFQYLTNSWKWWKLFSKEFLTQTRWWQYKSSKFWREPIFGGFTLPSHGMTHLPNNCA